jgi:hypothetical protein
MTAMTHAKLVIGVAASLLCQNDAKVTLIENGAARSAIWLAAEPTPSATRAATELQRVLLKMTGAEAPIRHEGADQPAAGEARILVGDGEQVRALGLSAADLPAEGILVATRPDTLVLVGSDKTAVGQPTDGTYFAVSTFLQKELGVRWIWPGETGEIIPLRETVTVGPLDYQYAPKILMRRIRDAFGSGWYLQDALKDRQNIPLERRQQMATDSQAWFSHQRCGWSVGLASGHMNESWYETYFADHPDWFALHPDGTREIPEPSYRAAAKLCVTNPGALDAMVAQCEKSLAQTTPAAPPPPSQKTSPTGASSVGVGPNDGGDWGYCMCEKCKALDPPEGRKEHLRYPKGEFDYVSLSDRYLWFYNQIAQRLQKTYPDAYVIGFAYGAYTAPPIRTKAHPRVVIQYVGAEAFNWYEADRQLDHEQWDGWAKAGVKMAWRPNWIRIACDMPFNYTHRLAEDLKRYADHGLIGADFDTWMHDWGTQGLGVYVLAQLLWDPSQDTDALIDDYCRAGFGPAAPAVKAYLEDLEALTEDLIRHNERGTPYEVSVVRHYTPEAFVLLNKHLRRARELAKDDPAVQARIDLLDIGLQFGKHRAGVLAAIAAVDRGEEGAKEKLEQRMAAQEHFWQAHLDTWAVNIPYAIFDEWRMPQIFKGT